MKLTVVDPEQEKPRCNAQPSKYSMARCEMPLHHRWDEDALGDNFHAGRTPRGYWKFWPVTDEDRSPGHG